MSDIDQFSARLMVEIHARYLICEDFAATPSSILLAVVNAIAKVRSDMGLETPATFSSERSADEGRAKP